MSGWEEYMTASERMLLEELDERKFAVRAERRKIYDRARKRMERANTFPTERARDE